MLRLAQIVNKVDIFKSMFVSESNESETVAEDGLFKVLVNWRDSSRGTYESLRQILDQYSIFAGRNILVRMYISEYICMNLIVPPLAPQKLAGLPIQDFSADDILIIESDAVDEIDFNEEERSILSEYKYKTVMQLLLLQHYVRLNLLSQVYRMLLYKKAGQRGGEACIRSHMTIEMIT